ncbi:hypothetical protein Emed_004488 [Eimeria media]
MLAAADCPTAAAVAPAADATAAAAAALAPLPGKQKETGSPCTGEVSPCAAAARAPTPDGCRQQQLLSAPTAAAVAGEPAQPQVAIAILRCPTPSYDPHHQQQQQQQQQQQGAAVYGLVPPPPHMLQQLQVPSNQESLRSNLLREEVGEIGSKGALESFSPTFATELLADIELEGGDDSPPAAAAAAAAAPASAPAATLCIEVPLQRAETAKDRKHRSLHY